MLISPGFGREQRKGVQRAPALRASAWTRCAAVRRTAAGPLKLRLAAPFRGSALFDSLHLN